MKDNRSYLFGGLLMTILVFSCWAATSWSAQAAPPKAAAKVQQNAGRAIDVEGVIRKKSGNIKSNSINSHSGYQATRSTFLNSQKSRVDASNAETQAKINRLKANAEQYAKIRAEAIQMNSKYAAASPAEKSKMDKRAEELMAELNRLGY